MTSFKGLVCKENPRILGAAASNKDKIMINI